MRSLPPVSPALTASPKEREAVLKNLRFIATRLENEGGHQTARQFRHQARLLQQKKE